MPDEQATPFSAEEDEIGMNNLKALLQKQIAPGPKQVLRVHLANGKAYDLHHAMGDKSFRVLAANRVDEMYRESFGKTQWEDHPERIPGDIAVFLLNELAKQYTEEVRSELCAGAFICKDEEEFVKLTKEKWGFRYNDDGTVIQVINGFEHDSSEARFKNRLRTELAAYNRSLPKDPETKRPMAPIFMFETVVSALENHNIYMEYDRLHTWVKEHTYTGNSNPEEAEMDLDEVVTQLLSIYYITPTEEDKAMFKHMLWSIKRYIFRKNVDYDVFFSFQSNQGGMGKTELVKKLSPAPWMYKGHCTLDALDHFWDAAPMIRGKYLLDFEELAMTDSHASKSTGEISDNKKATLKSATTAKVFTGRGMQTTESRTERRSAVFAATSQIHIYDIVGESADSMRRWWEFKLDPPKDFDKDGKDKEFYLKANVILDVIGEVYKLVNENDECGYYHPSKPWWDTMNARQRSYVRLDAVSRFMMHTGIEFCDPSDKGAYKFYLETAISRFNSYRSKHSDRIWNCDYFTGVIRGVKGIEPESELNTAKRYYWCKPVEVEKSTESYGPSRLIIP